MKALAAFGAPLKSFVPKDFQSEDSFFQVGVAPNRIDILQTIAAVDFASAWEVSEPGMTGDGIPVPLSALTIW